MLFFIVSFINWDIQH